MFRSVLVAVDGSAHADEALAQAIDLADSEHACLTLIAGVTGLPSAAYVGLSGPAFAVMQADARSSAKAVLRRARERVPDGLPVTTILTDEPIQHWRAELMQRRERKLPLGLDSVRTRDLQIRR